MVYTYAIDSRACHWSDNELVRFMMQGLGN